MPGTQGIEYFKRRAMSNSLMGVYENDFSEFRSYWVFNKPLKKKDSYGLTLGSVIDTMLTRPEDVGTKIRIGMVPTGQILIYIHELAKTVGCNHEIAYKALEAQNGGKVRDSIDKFKKKFEDYEDYYKSLTEQDIILIDSDTKSNAQLRVDELRKNPYTRLLTNIESSENVDVYYQLELYYEINGLPCKAALDKVIVDHKNKRVTICDFKTSSNPYEFSRSVEKYNYWRQGSFYRHLIIYWMKENGLQGYYVNDFVFIVISTTVPDAHFVARLTEKDCKIGEEGGVIKYNDKYKKGWKTILDEIKYMRDIGNFKYPYNIQKENGVFNLDVFKDEQYI